MKRHLPWRTSLDAPSVVGRGQVPLWPGGEIAYFNDVREQAEALAWAVRAWNESGARIRFRAVARDEAQLIVVRREQPGCQRAEASLGRVRHARVRIFGIDPARRGCDRYHAARALAHELGHVLGLQHEEHACAAMNPSGGLRGAEQCRPTPPGTWACRLLEPFDVARAIELYGGAIRPARPRACPFRGVRRSSRSGADASRSTSPAPS